MSRDRCACGAPLVRGPDNPRGRLLGMLLEYCPCASDCGSTTTVIVEACDHAHASLADGRCLCLYCGHTWYQAGPPARYELVARQEARQAVGRGVWR